MKTTTSCRTPVVKSMNSSPAWGLSNRLPKVLVAVAGEVGNGQAIALYLNRVQREEDQRQWSYPHPHNWRQRRCRLCESTPGPRHQRLRWCATAEAVRCTSTGCTAGIIEGLLDRNTSPPTRRPPSTRPLRRLRRRLCSSIPSNPIAAPARICAGSSTPRSCPAHNRAGSAEWASRAGLRERRSTPSATTRTKGNRA